MVSDATVLTQLGPSHCFVVPETAVLLPLIEMTQVRVSMVDHSLAERYWDYITHLLSITVIVIIKLVYHPLTLFMVGRSYNVGRRTNLKEPSVIQLPQIYSTNFQRYEFLA